MTTLPVRPKRSRTRFLSATASFAVLYATLRLVPTFPMIGVAGTFSASDVVAPLYGLILGPYAGGASIVLGTFLAIAFGRPMIFLGLDFLPAAVGAVALGLLVRRRFLHITGLYTSLLILFLVHPLTLLLVELPNGALIPYNWLHFVAFILLVSPLARRAVDWVLAPSLARLARGLSILCFIGTMTQHLTGAILFESILGLLLGVIKPEAWPGIWTTIFYVYPIERVLLTILATLVGSTSLRALRAWLKWPSVY